MVKPKGEAPAEPQDSGALQALRQQQGRNYTALPPSNSICVLAGAFVNQTEQLHLDFRLRKESQPLTLSDDLQIHFLQLEHLQMTAETLYTEIAVERWCWFLSHTDELTTEQIARLLPEQQFSEAAKVIEMIARTPNQHREYNARLKAPRYKEARILCVQQQQQGIEIGEHRGESRVIRIAPLQGQILQLQQLNSSRS